MLGLIEYLCASGCVWIFYVPGGSSTLELPPSRILGVLWCGAAVWLSDNFGDVRGDMCQ